MKFDDAIDELNNFLEDDAKAITLCISNYTKSPLSTKVGINLNAFNVVVPFDVDPVKGTTFYKDLEGRRGIYIFLMEKTYARDKHFNNVYFGSPLKEINISVFNPGDIFYVGTAKSLLTRMHQHFAVDNEYNRTGSLKLGSDYRKSISGHFRIYAFCIKEKYHKYYPIIGPAVEKWLHGNLNVLVGND